MNSKKNKPSIDLSAYPQKAGVYLMKDASGKVLYVGKAKNLKQRLSQYFAKKGDEREMIPFLVKQIHSIDTLLVFSEKEALILENNLIKKHAPKYNVLLKDDKSFIHLALTDHSYPMLQLLRSKERPKKIKHLFGPYTNTKAARRVFDLILQIFPLRQCSDREFAKRTTPCILYDIKKCAAPCVHKCSDQEYQFLVEGAKNFLQGKDKTVLEDLTKKMEKASENLEYEKAKSYLETIQQIEHLLDKQLVDLPDAINRDVIGIAREADLVVLSVLQFRQGKLLSAKTFSFSPIFSEEEEIIKTFLLQNYATQKGAQEIFIPFSLSDIKVVEEILYESSKEKVAVLSPKSKEKKRLLEMAHENALSFLQRKQKEEDFYEKVSFEMQEKLRLNRFPRRIECIDTSHISSQNPVAALVCFINGKKEGKRQRYFQIRKEFSEDYASMKEALLRHFSRLQQEKSFCDLLIVDGGKGQLNLALQVFAQLNIVNVDVIALAKETSLHTKGLTQEKIFVPHKKEPLVLPKHSPILFFLQKIRDEAHRVAIGYHRKKHKKELFHSSLDDIPGIGPKKKRALLQHFKGISKIKEASQEELEKLPFLQKQDAKKIYSHFSKQA